MIYKPYRGASLNVDHPTAKGMTACWPLNHEIGSRILDVKGRHNGIADGAGGVPLYVRGNPDFDNTANKYYSIQNHADLFTGKISIFFILRDISTVNNSYFFSHKRISNFDGYNLRCSTGGRLWGQFFDGTDTTGIEWKYFPSWTPERRGLLFVIDVTGELAGLYINGVRWEGQGRWQATGTIGAPTASGFMWLGHGGENQADCGIECCYMWNRLIEDQEAMSLWREPYQMFQSLDYGFLTETIVSGNPWYYYRHQGRI